MFPAKATAAFTIEAGDLSHSNGLADLNCAPCSLVHRRKLRHASQSIHAASGRFGIVNATKPGDISYPSHMVSNESSSQIVVHPCQVQHNSVV